MTFKGGVTIDPSKDLVLSYSSLELYHSCPRKFELYKVHPVDAPRDTSPALSQGSAVGHGYAAHLMGQGEEQTRFETWLNYYPPLEDNVRTMAKAQVIVQALIDTPMKPENEDDPLDWELAYFNNQPTTELSFCIRLTENMVYVGYLDAVLYSPSTGRYRPLELKTSSLQEQTLEVNFKNSAQGLAYALVLDTILGKPQETFAIQYRVAQVHRTKELQYRPTIHDFYFTKTLVDRLEWLIGLKMEVESIQNSLDLEMFPKRGSSCLAWNRPCQFYGICNLTNKRSSNVVAEPKDYQFYWDLEELIQQALELTGEVG